jgi:hypothetical protein
MSKQRIKPNYRRRVLRLPSGSLQIGRAEQPRLGQRRAAFTSTPLISSLPGTAPSLGSLSTASL